MIHRIRMVSALGLLAACIASPATGGAAAGAQAPRVVTVQAFDYRFEAPASVPAGTITFRLANSGKEIHHLWIVRLTGGKTLDDFNTAMEAWGSALKMPAWAIDVGGPNNVGFRQTAEGTMTLEPGTYVLVCWVPSPDGMLHVMKGMVKPFTVTARGATKAAEPQAGVVMTLTDFAFDISPPITAGRRTIRIENQAAQTHEAVIARLLPDHTLAQAITWMNEGQLGAAPVELIGGASGLAKGRRMYVTVDFTPGRYALLCFIPDVKNGKPHSALGMATEFVVAR